MTMANKTNLGIGGVIVFLAAAYFGFDLTQQNNASTDQQSAQPPHAEQHSSDKGQQKTEQLQSNDAHHTDSAQHQVQNVGQSSQNRHGLEVIRKSFERKISNVQVQSSGQVKAILRDDNEGSRHQKFILKLDNGLTVLVAHNIDLAPRIENLKKGDMVEFFGEYEYSAQGGVMHWTHHDPQRRHTDGWLKHQGRTYQ